MAKEISEITKSLVENYPSWTKMRKNPEESHGAQFLNAFGLEFEDIEMYLDEQLNNQFIGTTNLGKVYMLYKANTDRRFHEQDKITINVGRDSIEEIGSVREFYESDNEDVFIVNRSRGTIYAKKDLEGATMDIEYYNNREEDEEDIELNFKMHHVWNSFDELGLLLGIRRIYIQDEDEKYYIESNEEFKDRILDVFKNPGNSTLEGMKNSISRILSIPKDHVIINELSDREFIKDSVTREGIEKNEFTKILGSISAKAPINWKDISWDENHWRDLEEGMAGLDYLPKIWRIPSDNFESSDFQSGIGDNDDLKVSFPDDIKDEQEFNFYVRLEGIRTNEEEFYVPHKFSYKVYAEGRLPKHKAPSEQYYYTVEAGEIIPLEFTIRAYKRYVEDFSEDFSDIDGYDIEDSVEIVPGNTITSPNKRNIRIRATLKTDDLAKTPILNSIKLKWKKEDSDEIHETEYTTYDDLHAGATPTTTVDEDGYVHITREQFYQTIDSTEEWENSEELNNITIEDGKIRMKSSTGSD